MPTEKQLEALRRRKAQEKDRAYEEKKKILGSLPEEQQVSIREQGINPLTLRDNPTDAQMRAKRMSVQGSMSPTTLSDIALASGAKFGEASPGREVATKEPSFMEQTLGQRIRRAQAASRDKFSRELSTETIKGMVDRQRGQITPEESQKQLTDKLKGTLDYATNAENFMREDGTVDIEAQNRALMQAAQLKEKTALDQAEIASAEAQQSATPEVQTPSALENIPTEEELRQEFLDTEQGAQQEKEKSLLEKKFEQQQEELKQFQEQQRSQAAEKLRRQEALIQLRTGGREGVVSNANLAAGISIDGQKYLDDLDRQNKLDFNKLLTNQEEISMQLDVAQRNELNNFIVNKQNAAAERNQQILESQQQTQQQLIDLAEKFPEQFSLDIVNGSIQVSRKEAEDEFATLLGQFGKNMAAVQFIAQQAGFTGDPNELSKAVALDFFSNQMGMDIPTELFSGDTDRTTATLNMLKELKGFDSPEIIRELSAIEALKKAEDRTFDIGLLNAAAAGMEEVIEPQKLQFEKLGDTGFVFNPLTGEVTQVQGTEKVEGVTIVDDYFAQGTITGANGSPAWSYGLDFQLKGGKGAAVPSPVSGEVIDVITGNVNPSNTPLDIETAKSQNGGFGNQVKIRTSNGDEMWISHLDNAAVQIGDQVNFGDIIGSQGNTGVTMGNTGVHLDLTMKNADGSYKSAPEVQAYIREQKGTGNEYEQFINEQIALSVIPTQLKNSEAELNRMLSGIQKGLTAGQTPYEVADQLIGFKIDNPDQFSTKMRELFSMSDLNGEQIKDVARLINSGNKIGAMTKIENSIMNAAKKSDPDGYIGEPSAKLAVQRATELDNLLSELGE